MERIEHLDKYESKEPIKKRLQRFLLKHIIWVPIICLLTGLLTMLLIYQQHTKSTVRLGVNYENTVKRKKNSKQSSKSRLKSFEDKIFRKEQAKRKGRYDRIINGKDVVSVDFGKVTYEDRQPEPTLPKKDTVVVKRTPKIRKKVKSTPVPVVAVVDTIPVDTIPPTPQDPFASIAIHGPSGKEYVRAYVYGDQHLEPNTFIKLRLGEPMQVQGQNIPRGTVFSGRINISANAIFVSVNRIERFNVNYEVYDADYSHGIVINRPKGEDVENAMNTSAYRSAGRSVMDLPYDILQDVTQSIIQQKRRKQKTIRLNDGYTVYLAKK